MSLATLGPLDTSVTHHTAATPGNMSILTRGACQSAPTWLSNSTNTITSRTD